MLVPLPNRDRFFLLPISTVNGHHTGNDCLNACWKTMRFDFFVLSLHFFRHTIDTKPSESWCLHSLWEGTQRFALVTRFSSSSNRHKNEKWRRDISGPLLTTLGDSLSSGALFAFPENEKLSLATATLCGYLSSVTVRSFFNDLNFLFVQQNRTGSVWSFAMNHNKRPDSFFRPVRQQR